jgi:N-carbamoyl-L-amino-acid hydrolase
VTPNAPNVVPGLVEHTIDLRAFSETDLDGLARCVAERAAAIAAEAGTDISIRRTNRQDAVECDPDIQDAIERAAARCGRTSVRLPSYAGHDAQMLAEIAKVGMIFVPSVGGVSHCAEELTTWEACADGAQVLLDTVLELAM